MNWIRPLSTLSVLVASALLGTAQGVVHCELDKQVQKTPVALGDVDGDGYADWGVLGREAPLSAVQRLTIYSRVTCERILTIPDLPFGVGYGDVADIDLDGDGHDDLVLGLRFGPDAVIVLSGATGKALLGIQDPTGEAGFAASVGATGDLNGDGVPELLIGSTTHDGPLLNSGRVVIVSGADGAVLRDVFGDSPHLFLGSSVTGLGDVDADGVDDFAAGGYGTIGSGGPVQAKGRVAVFSGASGERLYQRVSAGWDWFGASLIRYPDVDGDGVDEFLVGAPFFEDRGRAVMYSGRTGAELREYVGAPGEHLKTLGAVLGDIDQDGMNDIGFAVERDGETVTRVVSARDRRGLFHSETFGAVDAGDVDGDGQADMVTTTDQRVLVVRAGDCEVSSYCPGAPHSAGSTAVLAATGSVTATHNRLGFQLSCLPPATTGWLLYSRARTENEGMLQPVSFGDGLRCIGATSGTLAGADPGIHIASGVVQIDGGGGAHIPIDLHAAPFDAGAGALTPGHASYFQFYFRDPTGPGGTGMNSTNALAVRLCP